MNEELSVGIESRIPMRTSTWSVRAGNVTRKVAVLRFAIKLLGAVTVAAANGRASGLSVAMRCAGVVYTAASTCPG